VSYYFVFEGKFVKRFVQCHAFMVSSSMKRGLVGFETSVSNYHYSLRSNPEQRICEGITVLCNTGNYRPNDTVSHPRIPKFSASPMWEPNLSYFI